MLRLLFQCLQCIHWSISCYTCLCVKVCWVLWSLVLFWDLYQFSWVHRILSNYTWIVTFLPLTVWAILSVFLQWKHCGPLEFDIFFCKLVQHLWEKFSEKISMSYQDLICPCWSRFCILKGDQSIYPCVLLVCSFWLFFQFLLWWYKWVFGFLLLSL